MKIRMLPKHIIWSEACISGSLALAFVAIKLYPPGSPIRFHQIGADTLYLRLADANAAAEQAVTRLIRIGDDGLPLFASVV